nr:MAG TPA: upper collar protein [Caudoviricetes sp.]
MINGAPYYYNYINAETSLVTPSTVHVKDSGLCRYFAKYLLQKAMSVFEWDIPETWNKDYFLYVLYCWGYVAVINTDKFGVIPQGCGLKGYDVFYAPTHAVIANSLLSGILEPRIGTQCELLKLQPDFSGILDLVGHYAEQMALASQSVSVNLLNSKLSYVFTAKTKALAESLKKMYDQIASGEPAVVIDARLKNAADGEETWKSFEQNVGGNYIVTNLLADLRKIEAMFDTEIGIPNANTDKRERLIQDEVNANNIETYSKCAMWLENLQDACKRVNDMFGLSISVRWREIPEMGGASNDGNFEPAGAV